MSDYEKAVIDKSDEKSSSDSVGTSYTEEEERALLWKLDMRIIPIVTILYLSNFIDRSNIGNAKVAGFENDLGLVGTQYNVGLSVFFIIYALSEVPSNLVLKRFGAEIWIPTLVLGFGIVTFSTAFIRNFAQFMAVRALLGLFEGGMMPGVAYFLSTYYKRHELVFRVCIFISASSMAGAFGGLLASALLKIRELDGLPSGRWRNIFLVEGVLTMALAICSYFFLPGAKETTRFLTPREREIAIARMTEQASKEDAPKDHVPWYRSFKSINTWICAICFALCNICVQGVALFMPTLLRGMGHSVIRSQLLSVPPYVCASAFSVALSYFSFRIGKRGLAILITTPLSIAGLSILLGTANKDANYGGIFLLATGVFPQGPILLTWATNNSEPSTVRAVSSAMVVSIGTLGPIITSWIYLSWDAPRHGIANSVELGAECILLSLVTFLIWYNWRENKRRASGGRDYRLDRPAETVEKLGDLHPLFRLTL